MDFSSAPFTTFIHHPLPCLIEHPETDVGKQARSVIEDESIFLQQKIDGHRILLALSADQVLINNRQGEAYRNPVPPDVMRDIHALRAFFSGSNDYIVLDCELTSGALFVFDCPLLNRSGVSIQRVTPFERRSEGYQFVLSALQDRIPTIRPIPTARTTQEKISLVARLLEINAEGYVSRNKAAIYFSSSSKTMQSTRYGYKHKFTHDVDAIVLSQRGNKDSIAVGLLDPEKKDLVEIGACSTWGKGSFNPGDVVKVKYLYVGADGRLVQPRIIEKRSDKKAHECTTDQPLSHVNKDVILDLHTQATTFGS